MRLALPTGLLALLLLAAAGCGGGGSSNSWQVLDSAKFKSNQAAYLHTRVGRPSDVEIKVEASPNVKSKTSYSIACEDISQDSSLNKTVPGAQTPLTIPVPLPLGPPSACVINVTATSSKPAALTLTLLTRAPSGA